MLFAFSTAGLSGMVLESPLFAEQIVVFALCH